MTTKIGTYIQHSPSNWTGYCGDIFKIIDNNFGEHAEYTAKLVYGVNKSDGLNIWYLSYGYLKENFVQLDQEWVEILYV